MPMLFAYPWVLSLLILPLLAGAWEWLRVGRVVRVPFDLGTPARPSKLERLVCMTALIPLVIVAGTIVLLAGPQREQIGEAQREMKNIQLVLDSSSSMTIPFGWNKQTRHDAAMDAVETFLGRRPQDSFALTLFGGEVLFWIPLTTDLETLRLSRPFIRPDKLPSSLAGTLIGNALDVVGRKLSQTISGDRVVILITDGDSLDLNDKEYIDGIRRLYAGSKIVLFAVLVSDEPVSPSLQTLCQATGGETLRATDSGALSGVFDHIDRMTSAKLRPVSRIRIDYFSPILMCLIPALGLHMLLLYGVRFTPW